jgi:integrase
MVTKKDNSTNVISIKKGALNSIKLLIKRTTHSDHKPRKKDLYLRDERLIGYYIRIRPNGRKTYNCEAKLNGIGKKVSITIGDCDLFTEKQARDIATENLRKIKQGINPKDEIQVAKGKAVTLESLAHEYISIRDHLAQSTKDDYIYRIPQQLGKLASKPIQDITADDFVAWWGKAKAKGSRKVALRYVSSLYTYAIARKYVTENIAKDFRVIIGGIKAGQPKQTHIPKDELEDWMHSFITQSIPHPDFRDLGDDKRSPPHYWNDEPTIREDVRDYIMFLLVTGKRKSEVGNLEWKDIDFKKNIITLPKTKSGKVDVIPMTRYLWYMLKYRNESNSKHDKFVFPNRYRSGPIIDIRRALQKINQSASRGHTTAHDLRRTFATMAKELRMEKYDIAILLNHSIRDVTEGYIKASLEYKRDNLDKVVNAMLGHLQGWTMVYWYGADEGWDQGADQEEEAQPYYR